MINRLDKIKTPTLFIHTEDDFVVNPNNVPRDKKYENLLFMTTSRGSHACHITGYFKPRFWYGEPITRFINYFHTQSA